MRLTNKEDGDPLFTLEMRQSEIEQLDKFIHSAERIARTYEQLHGSYHDIDELRKAQPIATQFCIQIHTRAANGFPDE